MQMTQFNWVVFVQFVNLQLNEMLCSTSQAQYFSSYNIKVYLGGLTHDDPNESISNIVDVSGGFSFSNISQESIRLRLFPFSLIGEATKLLIG